MRIMMEEIKITVINQTENRRATIILEDDITGREFLEKLIENDFIINLDFTLYENRRIISLDKTFRFNKIKNNSILTLQDNNKKLNLKVIYPHARPNSGYHWIEITVNHSLTSNQVLGILMEKEFISNENEYNLSIFNANSINSNECLGRAGVPNNSMLVVKEKGINATILLPFGNSLNVKLSKNITFKEIISQLINDEIIIDINPLNVKILSSNYKVIDSKKTVLEAKIKNNDTIKLLFKENNSTIPKSTNATIDVKFIHPTNGIQMTISMDKEMNEYEIIEELVNMDFITWTKSRYSLYNRKLGLFSEKALEEKNLIENNILHLIPNTSCGLNSFQRIQRLTYLLKKVEHQLNNDIGVFSTYSGAGKTEVNSGLAILEDIKNSVNEHISSLQKLYNTDEYLIVE